SNEKEDNFIWALQQLRCLLRRKANLPKVILTDRDLALMNVIPAVFPDTVALVCRFHVVKNLRSKATKLVKVRDGEKIKVSEMRETVCLAFMDVLDLSTEDEYSENVLKFRKLCERWPKFVLYVEETILDTDKERVVNAWVDKYMPWATIPQIELKAPMICALDHIHTEEKRVEYTGMDSMKCGCRMTFNYGLPCACLIANKLRHNKPIRLDEVYKHWKIMCFQDEEGGGDVEDDYVFTEE
ncbi:protein FAR1-RElateD SEQUENCE 5, partial [Trifolium pratense]